MLLIILRSLTLYQTEEPMGIIAPIFDIRYGKVGTTVRDHKSAVTDDFPILLLL